MSSRVEARPITIAFAGRRPATTQNGYMSLVPAATLPGDLICILFECSTPTILRRACDEFKLVGATFTGL